MKTPTFTQADFDLDSLSFPEQHDPSTDDMTNPDLDKPHRFTFQFKNLEQLDITAYSEIKAMTKLYDAGYLPDNLFLLYVTNDTGQITQDNRKGNV